MGLIKYNLIIAILFCSSLLSVNLKLEKAIYNSDVNQVKCILTTESIQHNKQYYLDLANEVVILRRNATTLLIDKKYYEGSGWGYFIGACGLGLVGCHIALGLDNFDDPLVSQWISIPTFLAAWYCYDKAKALGFYIVSSKQKYENALVIKRLIYESSN